MTPTGILHRPIFEEAGVFKTDLFKTDVGSQGMGSDKIAFQPIGQK